MSIKTSHLSPGKVVGTNVISVKGRWAGGGAAGNCTRTSGRGISSVDYNSATGKYVITFAEVGEYFLGARIDIMSADGASTSFLGRPCVYSASAKTLTVNVSDVATPTNHDLATSESMVIDAAWDDSDAP